VTHTNVNSIRTGLCEASPPNSISTNIATTDVRAGYVAKFVDRNYLKGTNTMYSHHSTCMPPTQSAAQNFLNANMKLAV